MDSGPKADEILAPYLCPEIVQFMVRRRTTDELENDKIRRLNQKALAFVTGAKAIARTTTKLTREEWQAKHGHRLKKREPVPKEGEQKNVES